MLRSYRYRGNGFSNWSLISTPEAVGIRYANHPDLVRRLVIHSAARTLSEPARAAQMAAARRASAGEWPAAWAEIFRLMYPPTASGRLMAAFLQDVLAFLKEEQPVLTQPVR